MPAKYIPSVADAAARSAQIPVLPGVAGLVHQADINSLVFRDPATGTVYTLPAGAAGVALKIARGVHTQVAASDTVVTGLATVVAVLVSRAVAPVAGDVYTTATIGDQAGAPAAGSILIENWEADFTAGTVFGTLVNWVAIGT